MLSKWAVEVPLRLELLEIYVYLIEYEFEIN